MSSTTQDEPIPEEDDTTTTQTPLTTSASILLTTLPRDASKALETATTTPVQKITIRLQPIGSAPHLTQRVFKLSATQRFETIVRFVRRKLGARGGEGVVCYVGSVFSPGLDEGVGNLWENDELVVGYAMAPAFG
ncbi:ubiquitin-like autophagy protein Apg12-domain-containing protein [Ampelomyces quisqualis]|uniref:Ubiquitin-like protein ATG12 n=1 Tax=Ampelomyces quisqualis TaxID=50730 RepID=A0A6A5Q908_AMPQU|nr:ubiquitin-like autophagy protein Apg12-domain-containing protein [Ampelomyces quisqualis]